MIDILLTCSVGGTDTNWRNKLLGKTILAAQRLKEPDGKAKYSHCELITSPEGCTFGARWRTRERDPKKGLYAYLGSPVLIARPKNVTIEQETIAWYCTRSLFNGNIYPVHRLILQGLSATILPSWVGKIGSGKMGYCSEVVAHYLYKAKLRSYWIGTIPAQIEDEVKEHKHLYDIIFEGILKDERIK